MPNFNYEAIQSDGNVVQGTINYDTQMGLADKLHRDGLMVVSITPQRRFTKEDAEKAFKRFFIGTFLKDYIEKLSFSGRLSNVRVKFTELLFFITQLSSMVGSGLNLVHSITSLTDEVENRKFRMILNRVVQAIKDGDSFSNALSEYPKIFDEVFISLAKAGEVSGRLDKTLRDATLYMEKTINTRQKIKQALLYPCIIICVFILISIILVAFIVPQFQNLFEKLGADLPAPTKILIFINSLIVDHAFVSVFFLSIIVVGITLLLKIEKIRFVIDSMLLKTPLFGSLAKKGSLAKFARTLGILLENGVNAVTALEQLRKISKNRVIQKAIDHSITDIKTGKSISEAFTERGVFPKLVIQMATSGENAGTLPEMLKKVADHYERQVEFQVNTLSTSLEPIMIIFMAAVVAGILFAVYLPIFKMGEAIKGM